MFILELTIKRSNYEQLYGNKIDQLYQMEKFLQRHKLQNVTQEQIGDLNRAIRSKMIELVI